MPKYTVKQGYEHVVFSQEGVRRLSETEVESDRELNSPYLTLVKEGDQMTAEKPADVQAAPAQPVGVPAPVQPPAEQTPVNTEKESENDA